MSKPANVRRPQVVIVGAGFGGLSAAYGLSRAPVDITVIDRRNYHLFQPLLYQVATAALSPADIAWPIRKLLARQRNTRVVLGRVAGVDRARRAVVLEDGARFGWDYLVLATGARHSYFGHPEWEPFAPGLKKIDDATGVRNRLLEALEQAEREENDARRRALTTFVVVGGGPTGVEVAGALVGLLQSVRHEFHAFDTNTARVVLVEAGPRLLPAFEEDLSAASKRALERLGVEVRLGEAVVDCSADGVVIGDEPLAARTILWAAGVMASPAAAWLDVKADRAGRVPVAGDLSVPGAAEIFVIGDTAAVTDAAGRATPGIAPAAKQMGSYAARVIAARVAGRAAPPPFRYRDRGNLATIGRGAAVAAFGRFHISGYPAWILWAVAHIYFLIGTRNRILVAVNWLITYLTGALHARLIVGESEAETPVATPVTAARKRSEAA